jgi:hypothetical protein
MRKYLIYISMILAIGACKKKDGNTDPCGLIECPAMQHFVRFRIVESTTGQDYFFSNPPLYPVSELRVEDDLTDSGFVIADSVNKYIETMNPGANGHDLLISLPGLKADTIELWTKYTSVSCCASIATYVTAFINGVSVGTNLSDSTIFVIRK